MKHLLTILSLIVVLIQNLAAAERPNIVMIFTDDQRYDAVGYAGNDAVRTPNLERRREQDEQQASSFSCHLCRRCQAGVAV